MATDVANVARSLDARYEPKNFLAHPVKLWLSFGLGIFFCFVNERLKFVL